MSSGRFPTRSFPPADSSEEDCHVCESLGSQKPGMLYNIDLNPNRRNHPTSGSTERAPQVAGSPAGISLPPAPDIVAIGNAGWTTLHTMAAYYPERPSTETQQTAEVFLSSFAKMFPCRWCADDFEDYMSRHPPQVQSRQTLGLWMCEAHNDVNLKLGKEKFDCSRIDERWRKLASKNTRTPSGN
jgi:mitochondrial FAD-linked sulfhydryl oxidase